MAPSTLNFPDFLHKTSADVINKSPFYDNPTYVQISTNPISKLLNFFPQLGEGGHAWLPGFKYNFDEIVPYLNTKIS